MRPRTAQLLRMIHNATEQRIEPLRVDQSKAHRRDPRGNVWTLVAIGRQLLVSDGVGSMLVHRSTWTAWEPCGPPAGPRLVA